eukprot:ANDGO_04645.mRNA.1 hypothetical protein
MTTVVAPSEAVPESATWLLPVTAQESLYFVPQIQERILFSKANFMQYYGHVLTLYLYTADRKRYDPETKLASIPDECECTVQEVIYLQDFLNCINGSLLFSAVAIITLQCHVPGSEKKKVFEVRVAPFFDVDFRVIPPSLEFMIPMQRVIRALELQYAVGDRIVVPFASDTDPSRRDLFHGKVLSISKGKGSANPSYFSFAQVQWDNEEGLQTVAVWEMFPDGFTEKEIIEREKLNGLRLKDGTPSHDEVEFRALVARLFSVKQEEYWSISHGKIPRGDLWNPCIVYYLTPSIVRERAKNGYYRTVEGFIRDVQFLIEVLDRISSPLNTATYGPMSDTDRLRAKEAHRAFSSCKVERIKETKPKAASAATPATGRATATPSTSTPAQQYLPSTATPTPGPPVLTVQVPDDKVSSGTGLKLKMRIDTETPKVVRIEDKPVASRPTLKVTLSSARLSRTPSSMDIVKTPSVSVITEIPLPLDPGELSSIFLTSQKSKDSASSSGGASNMLSEDLDSFLVDRRPTKLSRSASTKIVSRIRLFEMPECREAIEKTGVMIDSRCSVPLNFSADLPTSVQKDIKSHFVRVFHDNRVVYFRIIPVSDQSFRVLFHAFTKPVSISDSRVMIRVRITTKQTFFPSEVSACFRDLEDEYMLGGVLDVFCRRLCIDFKTLLVEATLLPDFPA